MGQPTKNPLPRYTESGLKMYMVQNKVNTQTPCFVVEMFLVDGALDTTFKVPIFMKIYICKIQDEVNIITSKNKSQKDFLTHCTTRQHGG